MDRCKSLWASELSRNAKWEINGSAHQETKSGGEREEGKPGEILSESTGEERIEFNPSEIGGE